MSKAVSRLKNQYFGDVGDYGKYGLLRRIANNGIKIAVNWYLTRQEVAFRKECRKIKGCGSLKVDFYARFKPKNKGFGAVTWWKRR